MTRQRSRLLPAVVSLAAAAAVVYACTDYLLTAPEERAAKRDVTPPQFSVVGGDSGMVGTDQFTLPTPTTNLDIVPWTGTGIQVEEGRAVRVTANGILTAVENPERDLLPTPRTPLPGGLTAGPAGWIGLNGGEHVQVRLRRPNQTLLTVGLAPQDQTAESIVGYVQGPGGIEVTRQPFMGGAASCIFIPDENHTCADGTCPRGACYWAAADYLVTGTQTLTVEALDPAIVTAVPTVVDTGEAVDFEVTVPWTEEFSVAPNLPWTWVPDVGSAIRPPASPENGCGTYKTCRYSVRQRGHMFLRVGAYGISYDVESPTIEVRPDTTPPVSLAITVTTHRANGSFTADDGENLITLHADVTPAELADSVRWTVEPNPGHYPDPPLPTVQLTGTDAQFTVAVTGSLGAGRWPTTYEGALPLEPKQLSYRVKATVVDQQGGEHTSEPETVTQDEIDTAREEYLEFGHARGVPNEDEFAPYDRCKVVCTNTGDYTVAILNPAFAESLEALRNTWQDNWQVNSIYRNPVNNRNTTGAHPQSFHQDGCGADLQTFPRPRTTQADTVAAIEYWHELNSLAISLGFDTEDLGQVIQDPTGLIVAIIEGTGPGHVHVELDPCPLPER